MKPETYWYSFETVNNISKKTVSPLKLCQPQTSNHIQLVNKLWTGFHCRNSNIRTIYVASLQVKPKHRTYETTKVN